MNRIIVQHSGKCIECDEWIMQGEPALWIQGIGIKCIECKEEFTEDNSRLIIYEPDEEFYLKWTLYTFFSPWY